MKDARFMSDATSSDAAVLYLVQEIEMQVFEHNCWPGQRLQVWELMKAIENSANFCRIFFVDHCCSSSVHRYLVSIP